LTLAGTAQPIYTATELGAGHNRFTTDVEIFALATNSGNVYVGNNVDNTAKPIYPGTVRAFSSSPLSGRDWPAFDMQNMYFDGDTTGDIIIITYYAFAS